MARQQSVITIGNFDGVHVGHAAILRCGRALAYQHNLSFKVLTFEPHPATVLRPGRVPLRLYDEAQKVELLQTFGVDEVVCLKPDRVLMDRSPKSFVEQVVADHRPMAIVEGPDFKFGRGRAGDVQVLAELGKQLGFQTQVVDRTHVVLVDQLMTAVSSTMIRWLIKCGRVADASRCLGRAFELVGPVCRGEQRGQGLGVPTANLISDVLSGRVIPADGVYAGHVRLVDDGADHLAAISVGIKPTWNQRIRTIEAHLLDFDGDLYDRVIAVRFVRWLRDQCAFPCVKELQQQLTRDIHYTRLLTDHGLLEVSPVRDNLQATG